MSKIKKYKEITEAINKYGGYTGRNEYGQAMAVIYLTGEQYSELLEEERIKNEEK